MRVTSDFFARALVRRANDAGAFAVLSRRGAAEAGTIYVLVDDLGGGVRLYGPAMAGFDRGEQEPSAGLDGRRFRPIHVETRADALTHLEREANFDPDLWIVEIEDREGRSFLDPDSLRED